MRYHLFLHYGWFLQNIGKDFIPTNMHMTVFGHIHIPPKIISTKEVLLGPDDDIEFLKHLMNILL